MTPDDVPAYAGAFARDPELARLVGFEEPLDEHGALEQIERMVTLAEEGAALEAAIADPGTGAFWGSMLLHSFSVRHRRCEVGYWVIPEVRGRGIGTRAVALVLRWGFGELDLLRIEMTTTPENEVVPALAARLGFTREGVLRARNVEQGRRVDIVYFGLLREEWSPR